MIEYLLLALFIIAILFPLIYVAKYKIKNKLLFVSAVYGINGIVWVIIVLAYLPISGLLVFIIPTLKEIGYAENIMWLIQAAEFPIQYWWYFSEYTLFIFPFLIYRRYKFAFESSYT